MPNSGRRAPNRRVLLVRETRNELGFWSGIVVSRFEVCLPRDAMQQIKTKTAPLFFWRGPDAVTNCCCLSLRTTEQSVTACTQNYRNENGFCNVLMFTQTLTATRIHAIYPCEIIVVSECSDHWALSAASRDILGESHEALTRKSDFR